jgi:dTDP-4-amino-4,6-dideoxygalactose transaminase
MNDQQQGNSVSKPKHIIYPLRYVQPSAPVATKEFERQLDEFLGSAVHSKLIGRARGGIYLLVKLSLAAGKNRVVLSPYTVPDVINMVKFAGGEPVFVDFRPASTNINLVHLAQLVDDRTCCVFVTHYHFNQTDLSEIAQICSATQTPLFDDCALAFGGELSGARIGTVTDASVFSFSGFKALNYFWGGAITTKSIDLAQKISAELDRWPILHFRQYLPQLWKLLKYDLATRQKVFSALVFPILKRKVLRGDNSEILPLVRVESTKLDLTITSRPSSLAVSEWSRKLNAVETFIYHRRAIAAVYDTYLADCVVGKETSLDDRGGSCLVNYPIFVPAEHRTRIFKGILARGFDVGLSLYPNVHEMTGFESIEGASRNVSQLVRSVISLPTHPRISARYAERLARAVIEVISEHS